MRPLTLSAAFVILLAASIAAKTAFSVAASEAAPYPSDDDIVALMAKHALKIERADPNTDPSWIYGTRDQCQVQIASVSVQGWHRAIVQWQGAGKTLIYSAEGKLYQHQPILQPLVTYYVTRLERQVGIAAPPVRVRAIVISAGCPSGLIDPADLAALS